MRWRCKLERTSRTSALAALLPIPAQIDRFVSLPAAKGSLRFLPLEICWCSKSRPVSGL